MRFWTESKKKKKKSKYGEGMIWLELFYRLCQYTVNGPDCPCFTINAVRQFKSQAFASPDIKFDFSGEWNCSEDTLLSSAQTLCFEKQHVAGYGSSCVNPLLFLLVHSDYIILYSEASGTFYCVTKMTLSSKQEEVS